MRLSRCSFAALSLALLVAGCQSDRTQKLVQAHELFTGALTVVNQEHAAGRLTTADLQKMSPYVHATEAALRVVDASVNGSQVDWVKALSDFQVAFNAFSQAQAQAKPPSTRASTGPP